MGRPTGKANLTGRLRAFELYAAGLKKADIARELNVTRAAVTTWARKDSWEDRLTADYREAERAVDFVKGEEVAHILATLKSRMKKRLNELEILCSPSAQPATRLAAIRLWLKLAGIDEGSLNPVKLEPKPLTLTDDLKEGS